MFRLLRCGVGTGSGRRAGTLAPLRISCATLGELLSLPVPPFPHLKNGDSNDTYLLQLLQNEFTAVKQLEQCLPGTLLSVGYYYDISLLITNAQIHDQVSRLAQLHHSGKTRLKAQASGRHILLNFLYAPQPPPEGGFDCSHLLHRLRLVQQTRTKSSGVRRPQLERSGCPFLVLCFSLSVNWTLR